MNDRKNRTTTPYGAKSKRVETDAEVRQVLEELSAADSTDVEPEVPEPTEPTTPDGELSTRRTHRFKSVDTAHGDLAPGEPPPPQRRGGGPLRPDNVEVDLVHVENAADMDGRWRTLEIWTKKSVYAVDADMRCFAVIDRATGVADARHRFVGARLMGGEHKSDGQRAFSYPVPVPGGDAVFQVTQTSSKPGMHAGAFGHTSQVERVLLRIRVTQVPAGPSTASTDALWADIRKTLG